jgi:hypothetical protein
MKQILHRAKDRQTANTQKYELRTTNTNTNTNVYDNDNDTDKDNGNYNDII